MFIVFALALSVAPMQLQSIDVPRIVEIVLDTAAGPKLVGNRTLMFDSARTNAAFRQIDPGVAPNYDNFKRAFVGRTADQAFTRCPNAPTATAKCGVVDNGIYVSVTGVQADLRTRRYKVMLLVLKSGPNELQGYEQEVFVVAMRNGAWRVDQLGLVRVIN